MQQAPAKKKKKVKVPRVINGIETMVEIEVDEDSGPGWGPNDKHTLLNHRMTRVDGPLKTTGAAKYSFDINRPNMLWAKLVTSPDKSAVDDPKTRQADRRRSCLVSFLIRPRGGAQAR